MSNADPVMSSPVPGSEDRHGASGAGMALIVGAIGIVFGDIGTSPLYTLKEAFSPHYGLAHDHDTVLGVLSLVFWALNIVVTLKYVSVIMRADNDGEGGIMALTALAQSLFRADSRAAYLVGVLGIFGASLFFGDGVITPAITVMGAIEGLQVAAPGLDDFVVPITLAVLAVLFGVQRFGTTRVGRVFGPVMCLWFVALAAIGLWNTLIAPEVLKAFNPWWAMRFFAEHGWAGIFIFGAVVLAVTGGEALYADMGHFGLQPIRNAWYFFVLPCLMLNYLGQGAVVLQRPGAVSNPFFEAVPDWGLYPMIVLATLAAVIASQSVITGAYSIARQAMQLGYIPRMQIRHTSRDTIGQIYIPGINWGLAVLVFGLVIAFGSSSDLAVAYGISVSATMLIDTLLLALVARMLWPRAWRGILVLCLGFLMLDLSFVSANATKLMQGALFPVALGIVLFTMMRTWRRGRELLREENRKEGMALDAFLPSLMLAPPVRVPGMAVFLTSDPTVVPHALLHNLKHNKVLHEHNAIVTVETLGVPYVRRRMRLTVEPLDGEDFHRVIVRFGFMEIPDVPKALSRNGERHGLDFDPMETTYFVSRESIAVGRHPGMPAWRNKLFAVMHRNAALASNFFRIPGNRMVEMGTQVEI
jgi:KUP system potassium uptake protein